MKQSVTLNVDVLRNFLKENEISEADFAARIGVAHSTVNRVLNGKRNPGGKFISGVLSEYSDLTFDKVFIFSSGLPKGKNSA